MKFDGLIMRECARQGMSVSDLARRAELPVSTVRNYLKGHEPSLGKAASICRALGLELYIGPPRGDPAPPESQSSRPSNYVIPTEDEAAAIEALRAAGVEIRRRRGDD